MFLASTTIVRAQEEADEPPPPVEAGESGSTGSNQPSAAAVSRATAATPPAKGHPATPPAPTIDVKATPEDEGPPPTPVPEAIGVAKPVARKTAAQRQAADKAAGNAPSNYLTHRVQVFLIPLAETASLAANPAQLALEGEVRKIPGYHPVDLVEELAVPPSPAQLKKVDEARRTAGDGNKQIAQHQYPESVNRFRSAVAKLEEAGAATDSIEYAELNARLAFALELNGDDEAAVEAFHQAARSDLAGKMDGHNIEFKKGTALEAARDQIAHGAIGSLSIVTAPPGSRVFLGGIYRGTTPVTVDKVPIGMNFLRVDRPGAVPLVQLVDVKEGADTPVKLNMKFTAETVQLQSTLRDLPRALDREKGVPEMVKALANRFKLERAVIATVDMAKPTVANVRVAVFDLPRETRLNDEHALFAIDAENGLENEIAKWAQGVFDRADKSRNRAAKDPLDRGDGTEGWYQMNKKAEPPPPPAGTKTASATASASSDASPAASDPLETEKSNYKPKQSKKKGVKSKDPLDHVDGTEEW